MEWDTSHRVVQWGSVLVLLALTEGMGDLFDSVYTHFLAVENLGISWKWCSAFSISSCALLFFSVVQQGPSFALFHNQYSSFPPFSYRDSHFSYSFNIMEGHFLEKMRVFWAKSALPNVRLKDVISMEGTNDNQPKSKPLGSQLQQRAFWTILCQTFRPVWEAVLKRTTFKPEALDAIKQAS